MLGFGQANSSMISQLALARKVKKIFAHCLNNVNKGGIFAIGEVVQPKVVFARKIGKKELRSIANDVTKITINPIFLHEKCD